MRRISVFCGSNSGNNLLFKEQAYKLGEELADRNIELVYGGAKVGLMGAVADGVLSNGGKAIGVLPRFFMEKDLEHNSLTELIFVDTMHERKAKMSELCDGIIALPGGFGTMEELFEMLTWAQLSLHKKPIALLNIDGYYDSLLLFMKNMIEKGFLKDEYRKMLLVSDKVSAILRQMEVYSAPVGDKWFVVK
ncbi:LOG family protein [Viscerimonas tarda]